jgi:L-fucose isomerase-like protein
LLEKFNIQIAPIPMTELVEAIRSAERQAGMKETLDYIKENMELKCDESVAAKTGALKIAMKNLAAKYRCGAVAIQCWNALQSEIGIMPCGANALLTDERIPVVCETDIHGAVSSLLIQSAALGEKPVMFADWTVRHPDNENGELLQHCGPWPVSLAGTKPSLGKSVAFDHPGSVSAEAKHGELTLARFDGDNGEYSLLLGNARGIDGPYTKGTYLWIEVKNWKRLEAKIVEGPYIHHCVAVHGDFVPVLYEACKYLGIKPDLYDNNEEEVKAFLRGE